MFRAHKRAANSKDPELREAVNRAVEHLEAQRFFLADECIVAIWNIFFCKIGVYSTDLDLLVVMEGISRFLANEKKCPHLPA
jgi:hypothetical protein